jgi:hypothetical protein
VAALIDSEVVPRWVRQLLLDVQADSSVELAVVLVPARHKQRRPSMFRLYEWLDRRLFASDPDALEPAPIGLSLERVDAARVEELGDSSLAAFLQLYKPDLVINLGSIANEWIAPRTVLGAWWLSMRAPERPPGGPMAFDELLCDTVVGTALLALKPSGETVVLQKSYGAVDRISLQRTRNRLLWKSIGFVPRSLAGVQAQGAAYLDRPGLSTFTQTTVAEPRAHVVIRHAFMTAVGIGRRRLRRLFYRDQWFVAVRKRKPCDIARRIKGDAPGNDFSPILTSEEAYFADPFLFEHAGTTHLFVERFSYRDHRASIWCCALDGDGRPGPLIPVVVTGSHVSYPFVFTSEGRIYLLTEAEAARRVPLYEAADFPGEWKEHPPLLENVDAVDPSLAEKDGLFWLFVNIGLNGDGFDDELHLFFAEELAGAWHPHPLNPIVSDVRRARSAGRIFNLDGRLVRPAQDGAEAYGHAVVFNRIDVMTPTTYSETVIGRLDPTWSDALSGTHTYGFDSRFEVVDGIQPIRRFRRWNPI